MHRLPSSVRSLLVAVAAAACVATGALVVPAQALGQADVPPQPGNFKGRGFDQCNAPTATAMARWMVYSPFQAVGIYISGKQRACREQPNLDAAWVARQAKIGWRLLPITLGPQPVCNPRFPRYGEPDMSTNAYNRYQAARFQGVYEARDAIAAARALGIPARSTLWYDLEGFDARQREACTLPALAFLDGWTGALRNSNYVPGVYSSAASGMRIVFAAKEHPSWNFNFRMPDRVWIADWDGHANVFSEFLDRVSYLPGDRMKQYRGGHNETWGSVRINIDSNWLELGETRPRPDVRHCGSTVVSFPSYPTLVTGSRNTWHVRALQCLLKERGYWPGGPINGAYTAALAKWSNRWKSAHGLSTSATWTRRDWVALLSEGPRVAMKRHSTDPAVSRLQRALNATAGYRLAFTGVYDRPTQDAVARYQARTGLPATGHTIASTWSRLQHGRF